MARMRLFKSTPERTAPQLFCPTCDQFLVYRHTMFTGVAPVERWDFFECRACGPFDYRHGTRQLRPTPPTTDLAK